MTAVPDDIRLNWARKANFKGFEAFELQRMLIFCALLNNDVELSQNNPNPHVSAAFKAFYTSTSAADFKKSGIALLAKLGFSKEFVSKSILWDQIFKLRHHLKAIHDVYFFDDYTPDPCTYEFISFVNESAGREKEPPVPAASR